MFIVCVAACPTGIAHTYMATESLETQGKELGYEIKVETQGSMGLENYFGSLFHILKQFTNGNLSRQFKLDLQRGKIAELAPAIERP